MMLYKITNKLKRFSRKLKRFGYKLKRFSRKLKRFSYKLKRFGYKLSVRFSAYKVSRAIKNSKECNIILIGTPEHGNLGDQAIAYAEKRFLDETCQNFKRIEIQFSELKYCLYALKENIIDQDIIMLHGGGNLGNEYPEEEELRRMIIKIFNRQKIILFPQTMYFDDSEKGTKEFELTKRIYNSHRNLILIAREKQSYQMMCDAFKNNTVIMVPDIVMYLNQTQKKHRRDVLLCFRNDVESILNDHLKQQIIDRFADDENQAIITDTMVKYGVSKRQRERELNKIWDAFSQSKLIVTDRLHGMVFAAITSTPCVVLSNYNHKVRGTYQWLKHLPYIKFVEKDENIFLYIDELLALNCDAARYNNDFTKSYYQKIAVEIDQSCIVKIENKVE
ncbi:polysaccharide pyruvyl transferase family protein [Amphibacillus jilinensis]|uniref:polysaccharide pyruvyl transferase family protein n=1 Tax=Amphibacillus jilinensis TaxID=1216008 RepID=UPI000306E4FA|nr:polysaccharide pyruvyl transferase family protein [Amphibacillus jilinensis]